jgi:DtxR family manganese transport transcriptional regulator
MPTPRKSAPFVRARLSHASENTADYLEAVSDLIAEKGEARLVDIAARLGISKATANKTLQRIQREGHIRTEPYRAVFLTDSGSAIAEEARHRHQVVLDFLLAGGVPEEVALRDSEGMEHHVSPETVALLERLTAAMAPQRKPAPGKAAQRRKGTR